jgi:hypothetical protein
MALLLARLTVFTKLLLIVMTSLLKQNVTSTGAKHMPATELDYSTFAIRSQVNLYILRQVYVKGYDTYDSCVVAAHSKDTAELMHPDGGELATEYAFSSRGWPIDSQMQYIHCELIGQAVAGTVPGVILASFNAG